MSRRARIHLGAADPVMAGLMAAAGPCRLEPEPDCPPFRALAHAIAHQQLNGAVAARILGRFATACGGGDFPQAAGVLAAPDSLLREVGFSFAKIAALRELAAATLDGRVPDRVALESLDTESIIERLTQLRGIGRWTVEMFLIFQLGRPDVLPIGDFGVRNGFRLAYGLGGLPQPQALARFGERWAPYRSIAAWYLWRAVDLERAGRLPKPPKRTRVALSRTGAARPRTGAVPRAGK